MSTHMSPKAWVLTLALLILAACETPQQTPPISQQGIAAELRTDGDAVFVNGRPARYGQGIRPGDEVTTGGQSSALIRFSDGTTVQLDQNTDPFFSWTQQELQIQMAAGLIEIASGAVLRVVRVITDTADFFNQSHLAVEVQPRRFTRADLFSGRIEMVRPQPGAVVMPGQYVLARVDGTITIDRTSPSRVQELRRRLDRWEFAEVSTEPQPNAAAGAAAGVAAAAIFGLFLGNALGGDDDKDGDSGVSETPYDSDDTAPPRLERELPRTVDPRLLDRVPEPRVE